MYVKGQPRFRFAKHRPGLGRTWGMVPRATVIAVLIGVEVALLYGMAVAISGGGAPIGPPGFSRPGDGVTAFTPQSFSVGARPALAIDVGMADVTIDTHPDSGSTSR